MGSRDVGGCCLGEVDGIGGKGIETEGDGCERCDMMGRRAAGRLDHERGTRNVVTDGIFDVATWGTGNYGRDVCSCLVFLFVSFLFNSPRQRDSWVDTQPTNGNEMETKWNGH